MIFGGLSEKDVKRISELLQSNDIEFNVGVDSSMVSANTHSIQNNLRAYSPPHVSTHIGQIEIEENGFDKMTEELKLKLLDFGITDQIPEGLDFDEELTENPALSFSKENNLAEYNRTGKHNLFEIIYIIPVLIILIVIAVLFNN